MVNSLSHKLVLLLERIRSVLDHLGLDSFTTRSLNLLLILDSIILICCLTIGDVSILGRNWRFGRKIFKFSIEQHINRKLRFMRVGNDRLNNLIVLVLQPQFFQHFHNLINLILVLLNRHTSTEWVRLVRQQIYSYSLSKLLLVGILMLSNSWTRLGLIGFIFRGGLLESENFFD
jgi:hypothetical protein